MVDRMEDRTRTSFGNAGVLAAGSLVPVTVPGLLNKIPKMLFDKNAPLFIQWAYLPRLLPFLAKYLSFARNDHVQHYAKHMSYLLSDSCAQHESLAKNTGAENFITNEDLCFGYTTNSGFMADQWSRDLRRTYGFKIEELDGATYAKRDPMYSNQFAKVACYKNHGRISDPGAYLDALITHFQAEGGELVKALIKDIEIFKGKGRALITDKGIISGDHLILAMGAWSGPLAKKLGLKKNVLESERGYHIELHEPNLMPKAPMMITAGKFIVTPMKGRIRCAGVVEFSGIDAPEQNAPIELIKKQVKALFPALEYDHLTEWMGRRPATTDSLPIIGAARNCSNAHIAFGHQHVGLTGGPKTGRLIADMVNKKPNNADLSAFDPKRYS